MHHKLAWKSWWLQGRDSEGGQLQVLTIELMCWNYCGVACKHCFCGTFWGCNMRILNSKLHKDNCHHESREDCSSDQEPRGVELQGRDLPTSWLSGGWMSDQSLHPWTQGFETWYSNSSLHSICFWHGWNGRDMLLTWMKWQRYIWGWFTCALGDLRTLTGTQRPPEENKYSCFYPCDAEHV